MVVGAVGQDRRPCTADGSGRLQLRQERLIAIDDLDDVGARLTLNVHDDRRRRRSSRPPASSSRRRRSTSATSDRRTGAPFSIGDDQGLDMSLPSRADRWHRWS